MTKLREIVRAPTFSGALLFGAALIAIIISNTALFPSYEAFLTTKLTFQYSNFILSKSVIHWINDGLMVLFFLLVGLEIKRELLRGVLRDRQQAILPAIGALGGLLLPSLIYAGFNYSDPVALHGWAIPAATDIAFSLGILALLGSRVPIALKIFLTALAIIDDIGAILIIAFFYSGKLSIGSLALAIACIAILLIMNRVGLKRLSPFYVVGFILWLSVLQSGVHATVAGIILAFTIPLEESPRTGLSPLMQSERALFPWVNFFILPLFAFANSGVPLTGVNLSTLVEPIPLGIIIGLVIGKQMGIFMSIWLLIKLKFAQLPRDCDWAQMYGIAILCGIGFTMSLFIGTLAFQGEGIEYAVRVRLGVLVGSLISGTIGYFFLRHATRHHVGAFPPGLHH